MIQVLQKVVKDLGVVLNEDQTQRIIKEFLAKRKPSVSLEGKTVTRDGSFTFVSREYGEPYHSLTSGALTEVVEKFIKPSGIERIANSKYTVRIIDIGFGLGYNVAVAIWMIKKVNPKCQVEVISFEKQVLDNVPLLPQPFYEIHKKILDGLPSMFSEGVNFRLLLGDARETVKSIRHFGADVVFHDGFSPLRNPELWTYHFLAQIKRLMDEKGVWVSYTSALPVRKALKVLGFGLSTTSAVGRKRGGTLARLGEKDNLLPSDEEKLYKSPYAIPFEDPNLCMDAEEIVMRYLVKVELQKCSKL